MAYLITKTNGDTLVTVPDTEKNTDYGVTLVGRNYSGYGVFLNDNFISLMENFANSSAPTLPLTGQLWFSTTTKNLSVWEGTAWKVLSCITSSESVPGSAGRKIGDFWFDNNTYQLKIWTGETTFQRNVTATGTGDIATITSTSGLLVNDVVTHANISVLDDVRISQILNTNQLRLSANVNITQNDAINFVRGSGWYTVGPSYTRGQKTNGIIPTTVTDTNNASHTVGLVYVDGSIIGTISNDVEYTPNTASTIPGFPTVKPGYQLRSSTATQIVKTVQSFSVGSSGQTVIQLVSNQDLQIGDQYVSANVSAAAGIQLTALFPNNAVTVATTTTVFVNEDVVFQRGFSSVPLYNGTSSNAQRLANKSADLYAQLDLYSRFQDSVDIEGNLEIGRNIKFTQNSGNLTIQNIASQGNIRFVSNVPSVGAQTTVLHMSGVNGLLTVRADPVDNLGVSTKQYVDSTRDVINGYILSNVNALINSAPANRQDFGNVSNIIDNIYGNLATLTTGVNLRATINNPAFTGVPTAPTATAGTNTTQIATTEFVQNLVSNVNSAWQANAASQQNEIVLKATINDPAFTGVPTAPTASLGTNTTQLATTAFVRSEFNALSLNFAEKASPTFTGVPLAPTALASTNTTQLATTAFVHAVIPAGIIMLWSGSSASIPVGWALCNGTNGTPDLRDRFVVGAGSLYTVGGTGGSKDAVVPSHTHTASATSTFTGTALAAHTHTFTGSELAAHTHTFTGSALPNHSHAFTGNPLSTSHTHTINDPGHTHQMTRVLTDFNADATFDATSRYVNADDANYQNRPTESSQTGITLNAASAGTPAGTISGNSAGTSSGTNSSVSAGTPAGSNQSVSAGTPSGTVATSVSVTSSGVSGTNANLPPYYALCYIMKTYG